MKNYLIVIFLLLSMACFGQFYDDFSDGNYTANPRWFMTDMDAQIVENNDGYAVELHPTGEVEESDMKKGSFRTANTLMDNTWWGCDLTFDVNENSEGEIRFYLMSTLPNLEAGDGYGLSIDLNKNRLILSRIQNGYFQFDPITTKENILNYGTINFSCQISKEKSNWTIIFYCNNKKIWQEDLTATPPFSSVTSTGFVLIENPNNPYNLRVNRVNCGDKPEEAEMIGEGDIVITEIMAKPNPTVGLPEVEWIEIYNTRDEAIALEGCKIGTPSKIGTLSEYVLEAQDYAILCSYNAAIEMSAITQKICIVESMPALNNDGNILTLKNRQNHTISFVEYSTDWYDSEPFKSDGGWSLERIDPSNPLSNAHTWGPSIDPRGGTPAERNSIAMELPDVLIPRIIGFGVENEKLVHIYFNKPMQGEIVDLKKNIEISGNSIKSLNWVEPKRETLELSLNEALDSTNSVELEFTNFVCISNWNMLDTAIRIALPRQARYMDLVFNELMPYVSNGNSKFIELYNNSEFYIDLKGLMLSNRDEDGMLKSSKIVVSESRIVAPHTFAVVATDTSMLNCSRGINYESLYLNMKLPSMPSKEGVIVLTDRGGREIDEVHYSNAWHHPTLKDLHNVSLERIDPMGNTQEAENWQSASAIVGYNTAGWENSQHIEDSGSESDKAFWLEEETFSPNNDGHEDLLVINYQMPTAGYTVTIDAYTRHGAHVCRVEDNQLVATEGYITWDGRGRSGAMVDSGIYVVVIQATGPDGRKIIKKLIAIKI